MHNQDIAGAEGLVLETLGSFVWARGKTTWPEAIGSELDRLGWSLAVRETGTEGSLASLLGTLPRLSRVEVLRSGPAGAADLEASADDVARLAGTEVGLAVGARERAGDMHITIAIRTPDGIRRERRVAFLGGSQGRSRAALLAAAALLQRLRASALPG